MLLKQISIFLENKKGTLAEVTKILGSNNINIRALSIADTTDFGILRLIVNKPELAEKILKENGYVVMRTDVLAICVQDIPGGLSTSLEVLSREDISIEYMYAYVGKYEEEALVIIKLSDPDKAIQVLAKNNINVLPSNSIYEE